MPYELDCDTCAFLATVEEEGKAYDSAKEHEAEHPAHFVLIRTLA